MFQCSTSSSLEIVDALTEAAEDTPDRVLDKVKTMKSSFDQFILPSLENQQQK